MIEPAGFAGFPTTEPTSPKFGKCDVPFETDSGGHRIWRICPTLRRPTPSPDFVDLSGRRVGALFVIGLFVERRETSTGAQWVVKCDCGIYELRSSSALKPENDTACCKECRRQRHRAAHPERSKEDNEVYALRKFASAGGYGFINSNGRMQAGTDFVGQPGGYIINVTANVWMQLMAAGKVQLNEDGRIGLTQKGRRAISEADEQTVEE